MSHWENSCESEKVGQRSTGVFLLQSARRRTTIPLVMAVVGTKMIRVISRSEDYRPGEKYILFPFRSGAKRGQNRWPEFLTM